MTQATTQEPITNTIRVQSLFEQQQQFQPQIKKTSFRERIAKLRHLENHILSHKDTLAEAVFNDFRKPHTEVMLTEVFSVVNDIRHTIKHLRKWMADRKVSTPITLLGASSYIKYEPKGVCLIIAPWNYPFNLAIGPLVYSIAAGNCTIIKPSEMTPHTSAFIKEMIADLFDEREVTVVEGGVETSQALLQLPFDHIFFTGSPAVGKIVMEAAAKHLTSVTLELGGKSPVLVDSTADLKDAAEKIAWGKFLNCGQTCIAPDYVLVQATAKDRLMEHLMAQITKMYSPDGHGAEQSEAYPRLVNQKHHARLQKLMADAIANGAKVSFGGQSNPGENYIEPTLITDVKLDMEVMKEEIFGPVLPIISYQSTEEALRIISGLPKPLALYVFSKDKKNTADILNNTTAGGSCINDCVLHISNPDLPFGGVNNSGIGKAHGLHGFMAFSNERAILKQRVGLTSIKSFYPPYTNQTKKLVNMLLKWL